MDKEIFEQLKVYEGYLHHAYYDSFCRLTDNGVKKELARLHSALFGNDGNILKGCSRCVLAALRRLGQEYFKMKEAVGKEPEPETQNAETEVVTKPKRKTATKKNKENKNEEK